MTLQFRASSSTPIRSAAVVLSVTYVPDFTIPATPIDAETALAQAAIDFTDRYQQSTDGPQPGDDQPVAMTVRQADKLAAIMDAARQGQSAYADLLVKVTWYPNVLAWEANPRFSGLISRSSADLRAEIDSAVPWPLHGPRRAQPDIDH